MERKAFAILNTCGHLPHVNHEVGTFNSLTEPLKVECETYVVEFVACMGKTPKTKLVKVERDTVSYYNTSKIKRMIP